ncbi:TadE/TadG family type IV pilus assembly protein [Terrabacter sp. 2RAF25]|uniref:TadE/TadG family type IV pilus assembly protein n=1 Tax=Terrabacter sp. 2RAF25 TaxID=3232998 RepID=UPI003F95957E
MRTTPRPRSQPQRTLRERGAAAVELAIVFPLLFLVIAGIVDFGRAFFTQIQVTNAAREGARAAVVMVSNSDVITRATNAAAGVPGVGANVVAACTSGSTTNASVQVTAPFEWILLGPAMSLIGKSIGGGNVTVISSTGVMRCGG